MGKEVPANTPPSTADVDKEAQPAAPSQSTPKMGKEVPANTPPSTADVDKEAQPAASSQSTPKMGEVPANTPPSTADVDKEAQPAAPSQSTTEVGKEVQPATPPSTTDVGKEARPVPPSQSTTKVKTAIPQNAMTVANWYKQDVFDGNDNKIGQIKDVLIDESGKTDTLIIGVGGFLGIGEKAVAVPFEEARVIKKDNKVRLVMDATKENLKNAPGFRYDSDTTTWVPDNGKQTQQ
jgi:sporulation protein YlmC with PRC-barrel domain